MMRLGDGGRHTYILPLMILGVNRKNRLKAEQSQKYDTTKIMTFARQKKEKKCRFI